MDKRRVVVSGMGVVSPFGIGRDIYWESIAAGRSGAALIESFDTTQLPTRFAASVPLADTELNRHAADQKILKTLSRSGKMAVVATQEAIGDAALGFAAEDPYRVGTSFGAGGTGLWDLDHSNRLLDVFLMSVKAGNPPQLDRSQIWANVLRVIHPLTPLRGLSNVPTAHVAIMCNARGNCQTITTACTSSTQAIGEAYRQIKAGIADVMICGGSDSMINPYGLVAFSMLGVLSTNNNEWQTAARPFDARRDGFMIGEGAAVFVLEEYEHCRRRGGRVYAETLGYAATSDAYRLTDEPPEAWGSIAAMRGAITDAGITPDDIDYINAHGTGTRMNDTTETHAIKMVLSDRAAAVPVSSTKSMVGHLVAAAGAIEFAACLLAIKHQTAPPTINYVDPDRTCDLDYVPNVARPMPLDVVLSNSFGFGGQNACLVIRRVP
jgi:3-oxoacyl-[acyl-carrier-protein] synthase II